MKLLPLSVNMGKYEAADMKKLNTFLTYDISIFSDRTYPSIYEFAFDLAKFFYIYFNIFVYLI